MDARPRSTSPRKKPPPLDFPTLDKSLPFLPTISGEASSIHSSNFTDQWRELSHSPIAEKLHIADSPNHIIPIPFTLKLPPKLSAGNTPRASNNASPNNPSPKQIKLVYTGSGYEKLESDDDDPFREPPESPTPRKKSKVLQPLPRRPPPVAFNKSRSPKNKIQQRLLECDELSIIEEKDSEASSRRSSVKSKRNSIKVPTKPRKIKFKSIGENASLEEEDNKQTPFPVEPTVMRTNAVSDEMDCEKSQFFPVDASIEKPETTRSANFKQVHVFNEDEGSSGPLKLNLNQKDLPPVPRPLNNINHSRDTTRNSRNAYLNTSKSMNLSFTEGTRPYSNSTGVDLTTTPLKKFNKDSIIPKRNFFGQNQEVKVSQATLIPQRAPALEALRTNRVEPLETNRQLKPLPQQVNLELGVRNVSGSSIDTKESESSAYSWDSLQKSIDITREGLENDEDEDLRTVTGSNISNNENESDWVDEDSIDEKELTSQTYPLRIQKDIVENDSENERYFEDSFIASYCRNETDTSYIEPTRQLSKVYEGSDEDDEYEKSESENDEDKVNENKHAALAPVDYLSVGVKRDVANDLQNHIYRNTSLSESATDSENEGTGKMFSFPNNFSNITNSEEIKGRSIGSTRSKTSRYSFVSSNGQIEIPDLSDRSVAGSYTTRTSYTSYNGSTFDDVRSQSSASTNYDLEPIGIPSKEARNVMREHLNAVYEDGNSDTDIESVSLSIGAPRSKSTPNLNLNQMKKTPSSSPQKSPVRHIRHKSMHSINFNPADFNKELPPIHKFEPIPAQEDKELASKIVVAPPPVQVNYAVDFVEAKMKEDNSQKSTAMYEKNEDVMNQLSRQFQNTSLKRHSLPNPERLTREMLSETSQSSYQSSRSSRPNAPTSISDDFDDKDSVVIDLTEDKYDITTIHRQNSTLSYKSVTEKTKNGEEVEVILVEDEEDLMSIYSKYRRMQMKRSNSTQSSNYSRGTLSLYNSIASSKNLQIKPKSKTLAYNRNMSNSAIVLTAINRMKSTVSNTSSTSSGVSATYNSQRIRPPTMRNLVHTIPGSVESETLKSQKRHTVHLDSNYFDYSNQEKYDFNSFIRSQNKLPSTTY